MKSKLLLWKSLKPKKTGEISEKMSCYFLDSNKIRTFARNKI